MDPHIPHIDVDEIERRIAWYEREQHRRASGAPLAEGADTIDLGEYNRRADERRRLRQERAAAKQRRAHRREVLEAALLAAVLVLMFLIVSAWLFSTPSHASRMIPAVATPEQIVAEAWPLARAMFPADSPTSACGDRIRVELRTAEYIAAELADDHYTGTKSGYYDSELCVIVLDRARITWVGAAATVLAHELGHDAGLPHSSDPSSLMYDGGPDGLGVLQVPAALWPPSAQAFDARNTAAIERRARCIATAVAVRGRNWRCMHVNMVHRRSVR